MSDIVDELREGATVLDEEFHREAVAQTMLRAADEIERLLSRPETSDVQDQVPIDSIMRDNSDVVCRIAHLPFTSHTGEWWVPVQILGYEGDAIYSIRKVDSLKPTDTSLLEF